MKKYQYTDGLVSILIPCYNVENCISDMFESIIEQTYSHYEIIVVNDASTDHTEEVLLEYKSFFEERKTKYRYLRHNENKGAAVAINTGLQHATGEFLIWPDADDILLEGAIKKLVELLQKNKDYGISCGQVLQVEKETGLVVKHHNITKDDYSDHYFDELLFEKKYTSGTSGSCMIRLKEFDKHVKNRRIYETHFGQNLQMVLPMAYHSRCGFVHQDVYKYMVSEKGHHRRNSGTFELDIKRAEQYKDCVMNTIATMDLEDLERSTLIKATKKEMGKLKLGVYLKYKCWKSCEAEVLEIISSIVEFERLKECIANRAVWIWGANECGRMWAYFLGKNGCDIKGFIDTNPDTAEIDASVFEDLDINTTSDFVFVSMRKWYENVKEKLSNRGFYRNMDYMYPCEDIIRWRDDAGI